MAKSGLCRRLPSGQNGFARDCVLAAQSKAKNLSAECARKKVNKCRFSKILARALLHNFCLLVRRGRHPSVRLFCRRETLTSYKLTSGPRARNHADVKPVFPNRDYFRVARDSGRDNSTQGRPAMSVDKRPESSKRGAARRIAARNIGQRQDVDYG